MIWRELPPSQEATGVAAALSAIRDVGWVGGGVEEFPGMSRPRRAAPAV